MTTKELNRFRELNAQVAEAVAAKLAERAEERRPLKSEHGYTRAELHAAFNLVCNPDDWKAPIERATVHPTLWPVVAHAVIFFTGTSARVIGVEDFGRLVIAFDGYRNGPAGDH